MLNVVHVPYYYNVFNCVDCLLAKFSFSVLAGVRNSCKIINRVNILSVLSTVPDIHWQTWTCSRGLSGLVSCSRTIYPDVYDNIWNMWQPTVPFFSVRANVTNGVMATPAHLTWKETVPIGFKGTKLWLFLTELQALACSIRSLSWFTNPVSGV